jgi:heterodisulfide reductase subunit A
MRFDSRRKEVQHVLHRVGVFLCECGPNIREAIDLDSLGAFAQGLEDVVMVKRFGLLCSGAGKEHIRREILEHRLDRVVIAACSPKEHEETFRGILEGTGVNPYFLQMANIREQCAWVVKDREAATEKAKRILNAAVRRVVRHDPLAVEEIECQTDVLVIGAGISGISAALTAAQKGRKVYLVEKLPCIGGKVVRYGDLFPTLECASCLLDPKLDEILHHENIEVLTLAQVQEVLGSYGNFSVKIRKNARFIDEESCIGCGACSEVCPVSVKNEFSFGSNERKAVYIPYEGALPHVALLDKDRCLHFNGGSCNACREICPFGSIDYADADQTRVLKVGAIILATGFDLFDPRLAGQYGYGRISGVFSSLEFEELLNAAGPTKGKLLLKSGKPPKRVAMVHCVGSRSASFHEHCSGICCTYLLKFSRQILENEPGVSIFHLFSDLCLPGKEAQRFYHEISREKAVKFLRMKEVDSLRISQEEDAIRIDYSNAEGLSCRTDTDMVVLAPAMLGGKDAEDLARILDIPLDDADFFKEENKQITAVSTVRDGILVVGCAQGPKDIQTSTTQGQAAAGVILSRLLPGEKLRIEPTVAEVDETLCSGCGICPDQCHYKSITMDDTSKRAVINRLLCRGCGSCAASCPSGAITARHFKDEQIFEEIKGLVAGS